MILEDIKMDNLNSSFEEKGDSFSFLFNIIIIIIIIIITIISPDKIKFTPLTI